MIIISLKILALKALLISEIENVNEAYAILEESIKFAEMDNLIRTYIDLGPKMAKLLKQFSSQKKSIKFIGKILKAFNAETSGSIHSENKQVEIKTASGWKDHLSPREYEILQLLSKKYKNKEIAELLFVSPSTVKRHLKNIYQKLNVTSREEAVKIS